VGPNPTMTFGFLRRSKDILYLLKQYNTNMKLLRKGKVKDIYEIDDGKILFRFSDRVSAFDVRMNDAVPRKGEVLCRFAEYWFNVLGTNHHMLSVVGKDRMIVKKLNMIPLECIVRGYFYGSLVERYNKGIGVELFSSDLPPVLATKLNQPMFDPSTKSETNDVYINNKQIITSGLVSKQDFDYLKTKSISLYRSMSTQVERAGFLLADVKFEFGKEPKTGNILLGDSLGPDEYRLWPKKGYSPGKIQESYDKQLLRDWLIKIGFKDRIDQSKKEGRNPDPPKLDAALLTKLSNRYIQSYELITRKKIDE
jgi:phosphoribosylaminoimidazole-succinocarboxamide synthase